MSKYILLISICCVFLLTGMLFVGPNQTLAASAEEPDRDCQAALEALYASASSAKVLSEKAKAVLVFPAITKAGFIVGGQYGEGTLFKSGKTAGYYSTVAASWGLQAGAQKFGYALFFMTDDALQWLDKSDGWEVGTGPSLVVIDKGVAGAITTTTGKSDIYAFFFSQKGLMAGIGLQGTKVTKIEK